MGSQLRGQREASDFRVCEIEDPAHDCYQLVDLAMRDDKGRRDDQPVPHRAHHKPFAEGEVASDGSDLSLIGEGGMRDKRCLPALDKLSTPSQPLPL